MCYRVPYINIYEESEMSSLSLSLYIYNSSCYPSAQVPCVSLLSWLRFKKTVYPRSGTRLDKEMIRESWRKKRSEIA